MIPSKKAVFQLGFQWSQLPIVHFYDRPDVLWKTIILPFTNHPTPDALTEQKQCLPSGKNGHFITQRLP